MAQILDFKIQSRDFSHPAFPRRLPSLQATRVWTDRRVTVYVLALALILIAFAELARAGGPQYVAGTSYFDAGLAGQPITWANGAVRYSTDQGRRVPFSPARTRTPLWRMHFLAGPPSPRPQSPPRAPDNWTKM
jgi:hypothetical protein